MIIVIEKILAFIIENCLVSSDLEKRLHNHV